MIQIYRAFFNLPSSPTITEESTYVVIGFKKDSLFIKHGVIGCIGVLLSGKFESKIGDKFGSIDPINLCNRGRSQWGCYGILCLLSAYLFEHSQAKLTVKLNLRQLYAVFTDRNQSFWSCKLKRGC